MCDAKERLWKYLMGNLYKVCFLCPFKVIGFLGLKIVKARSKKVTTRGPKSSQFKSLNRNGVHWLLYNRLGGKALK